jgi:hypothetical protein
MNQFAPRNWSWAFRPEQSMKTLYFSALVLFGSLAVSWSQTSPFSSKAGTPAPTLTARDIHVYPFAEEHKDIKFKPTDRGIPNELIVTVTDHIHFYGKKRGHVVDLLGVPTGHVGKIVILPPGDRSGTLTLKKSFGTTLFFNCFEVAGDKLRSQEMKLTEGNTYNWSVKNEGENTVLRIVGPDNKEVISHTIESAKVLGVGFAGTVRNEGNELDMTITFDR